MTEKMKEVLERTEMTLCRHLEDLNDEVDKADGRIMDHMVLDGIKDCLESLNRLKELSGNASEARPASVSVTKV